MAVAAPMPNASVAITVMENPGDLRNWRRAYVVSRSRDSSQTPPHICADHVFDQRLIAKLPLCFLSGCLPHSAPRSRLSAAAKRKMRLDFLIEV